MDLKLLNGYVLGLMGLFSICLYVLVIAAVLRDLVSRRSKAGTRTTSMRLGTGKQAEGVNGIRFRDQAVSDALDLQKRVGEYGGAIDDSSNR